MDSNAVKTEDNEVKSRLRQLAREVMSEISELFLLSGEQKFREIRRQRQAEGIAAAKAKGVHFGPQPQALPDSFEELRQAWREKRMTLRAAAAACGIPKTTFRSAALRAEMATSDLENSSTNMRKEKSDGCAV